MTQVIQHGRSKLDAWRKAVEELDPDFKHDIPAPSELTIAKLGGGGAISTDTCNQARKLRRLLRAEVAKAVEAECGAERWADMSEEVAAAPREPSPSRSLLTACPAL